MTTASRTRHAAAPTYYLGRPAKVWRSALRRRARQARHPDLADAIATDRDHMVAYYSRTIR